MDSTLLQAMSESPPLFREHLVVDIGGELKPLGQSQAPFQATDFAAVDGGWKRAVGIPCSEGYSRSYWERSRGASKSQDIGVMAAWALLAARQPIRGIIGAADLDQSKLIKDAVLRLVRANRWLGQFLQVEKLTIKNTATGSMFELVPADAPSAYGHLVDAILVDELTHVRSEEFFTALISTAAKKPNCFVGIIANAGIGIGSSWHWRVRENCRLSEAWHFSRLDGPAPWIRPEHLEEQRLLLPPSAFRRLWCNEWSSGSGDALSPEDLAAAFRSDLEPFDPKAAGWVTAGGVDLGLKHDWSCFAATAKHVASGVRRLAGLWVWKPPGDGRQVDLESVLATILEAHRTFRFSTVCVDPWQASMLCQRLAKQRVPVQETPFSGANLTAMASEIVSAFQSRTILLPTCQDLRRDLEKLVIEQKSYGFRLSVQRVAGEGHGDLAQALALSLLGLRDAVPRKRFSAEVYSCSEPSADDQLAAHLQSTPNSLWRGHFSVRGQ